MTKHIAILGAGSWGTALAIALARNNHKVAIWGQNVEDIENIIKNHCNKKYFPGIKLSPNITAFTHLQEILPQAKLLVLAVPSDAVRIVLENVKNVIPSELPVLIAAKGIDPLSGQLMPELVNEIIGHSERIMVLAGPSFAKEVAVGLPTALVIAGKNTNHAKEVAELFQQKSVRPYINHDLIGSALGGTLKNVIAIAVGISDGYGYGANARSALITRGLAEMLRLGKAIGALPETLFGLSGVGDLLLTCTDDQSRNRRFGLLLGMGETQAIALEKIGQAVEGATNAKQVWRLAKLHQVEMPIVELVYQVLHENLALTEAVENLLARNIREE